MKEIAVAQLDTLGWNDLREAGRSLRMAKGSLPAIERNAKRWGATCLVIDLGKATSKGELMEAVARNRALAPDYFGKNWDALHEIVNDLSWTPSPRVLIVWQGSEAFRRRDGKAYDKLRNVCGVAPEWLGEPDSDREPVFFYL